jgi:hypothetical protein
MPIETQLADRQFTDSVEEMRDLYQIWLESTETFLLRPGTPHALRTALRIPVRHSVPKTKDDLEWYAPPDIVKPSVKPQAPLGSLAMQLSTLASSSRISFKRGNGPDNCRLAEPLFVAATEELLGVKAPISIERRAILIVDRDGRPVGIRKPNGESNSALMTHGFDEETAALTGLIAGIRNNQEVEAAAVRTSLPDLSVVSTDAISGLDIARWSTFALEPDFVNNIARYVPENIPSELVDATNTALTLTITDFGERLDTIAECAKIL